MKLAEPTVIGRNVRRLRLSQADPSTGRPWTMHGFSKHVGLSEAYVRHLESGRTRHPGSDALLKIAMGLGVRTDDLMFEDVEEGTKNGERGKRARKLATSGG
jgi:transcriptional regulator with XRE-family HTH domain